MTTQNTANNETTKQASRIQAFLFGNKTQINQQMEESTMTTKQQIAVELKEAFGEGHSILASFEQLHEEAVHSLEEIFAGAGVKPDPEFYLSLIAALQTSKVDLGNQTAVLTFLTGNTDLLAYLQNSFTTPIQQPHPELAGDLHDGLLKSIHETGSFTDTFMWIALQAYGSRSPEHVVYAAKVSLVFDHDKEAFGEYVREQLGLSKKKLRVRDTALLTADLVRLTGDLTEKAIVATAKTLNKVAFQLPAKGVDKAVKRPEQLSNINIIKQGVNHPFKKESVADISARLFSELESAKTTK